MTLNPHEELADPTDVRLIALHLDELEADFACLDENERGRAVRFASPGLQRRFVSAHAALRSLLGWASGSDRVSLRLGRDAHGKPILPDFPNLHFSLSHCAGQALVAIGAAPLGVDIEALIPRDAELLAGQILTPAELGSWQLLTEPQQARSLTEAWTMKEALLKACGLGLRRDPCTVAAAPGVVELSGVGSFELSLLPATSGHCAALAQALPGRGLRIYRLHPQGRLERRQMQATLLDFVAPQVA